MTNEMTRHGLNMLLVAVVADGYPGRTAHFIPHPGRRAHTGSWSPGPNCTAMLEGGRAAPDVRASRNWYGRL